MTFRVGRVGVTRQDIAWGLEAALCRCFTLKAGYGPIAVCTDPYLLGVGELGSQVRVRGGAVPVRGWWGGV